MWYLLVWSLLTGGIDEIDPKDWPEIQKAIHEICIKEEILDQRESKYIFHTFEDFQVDLELIRERYKELKDAPKLSDSHFLPPREYLLQCLTFNRAYGRYIEGRLNSDPIDLSLWRIIKKENDELYKIYDLARDATCDYYITGRRQALKKLKDILQEEYYSGLPLFVNLNRFWEE